MIEKVCVYCASSTQVSEEYLTCAYELGKILAQSKITTVYGGGLVGSMGALANGVLQHKGDLIGIIPKFMMELEWGNPNVSEMIVVDTMAERKHLFIQNIDAVIALPGGTGTLEELAEIISLKKLGQFGRPVIIVNTRGFYDDFLRFFNKMIEENFIRNEHRQIFLAVNDPHDVLQAINDSPKWDSSAIKLAAL